MLVLGIDPGTIRLGYALLDSDGPQAQDYGALSFRSSLPVEERLYQAHSHIMNMIAMFQPDELAIEEPFVGQGARQFIGPALAVGQAQAAILIAAVSQGVPVFRYAPARVKSVVADHGAATKEQMQAMVVASLQLQADVPSFDAADALAVALCHVRQRELDALMQC